MAWYRSPLAAWISEPFEVPAVPKLRNKDKARLNQSHARCVEGQIIAEEKREAKRRRFKEKSLRRRERQKQKAVEEAARNTPEVLEARRAAIEARRQAAQSRVAQRRALWQAAFESEFSRLPVDSVELSGWVDHQLQAGRRISVEA